MYMYIYIQVIYTYVCIYISIYVYILKTVSKILLVYHTLSFVLNANDDQNTAVTRFSWTSCRKKTFCTYWFGRISAVCDFVCSLMGAQCGVQKVPCLLNTCTILHSSRVVCNVLIPRAVLLCKTSVVDWVDWGFVVCMRSKGYFYWLQCLPGVFSRHWKGAAFPY